MHQDGREGSKRALRISIGVGVVVVDGSGVGITTSSFNNEHSLARSNGSEINLKPFYSVPHRHLMRTNIRLVQVE